jgi:hypothetical protein
MFPHWDSFYVLIGSAAGALIGLLFVVATLTAGREQSSVSRGTRVYMTPTVFHFAVVMALSALATAPEMQAPLVGLILGACAVLGLLYSLWIAMRLRRDKLVNEHWSDFWCYGVAPTATYLGLGTTAVSVWTVPSQAPYGAAFLLLVLLLVGIRNAWDLVTFLAPRQTK